MQYPLRFLLPDRAGQLCIQHLEFLQIQDVRESYCEACGNSLPPGEKDRNPPNEANHKGTYFRDRQRERSGRGLTIPHPKDRPVNHAHKELPPLRQHREEVRGDRNCMRERRRLPSLGLDLLLVEEFLYLVVP